MSNDFVDHMEKVTVDVVVSSNTVAIPVNLILLEVNEKHGGDFIAVKLMIV